MAPHKEFEAAGKKPGLQVWRVEKMDLKAVPAEVHGNFYTGDSYIVLFTTEAPAYCIHTWIGAETSQDEQGAAAIFMTQLDDFLQGAATQFTEFQNYESINFMGYFKKGIKYQKGGVASGFNHIITNEANVQRVLKVKGRHQIRATEVDLSWLSFNKGDCFIIDLGKDIFSWAGSESNRYERLKATLVARDIRDNERKGRAAMHLIDEGSEPETVIKVLGPLPQLPPGSCDTPAHVHSPATLYMVSNASSKEMKVTQVADKSPFKQMLLSKKECYIVDNGKDNKIFIWKGSDASKDERSHSFQAAKKFIKDKNYSPHCQIQILPQGAETTLFKEYFENWMDKDESTGPSKPYTIGRIAVVEQIPFDASSLHNNTRMAAQHGMVDDGSGKVQIWRVEGGDKVLVDPSTHGEFFGGDCYLVLYSYNDCREKHIIYIWQGNKCSKDELGASAILAVNLDDSMGGIATQVRVTQGQEPPHLLSVFKGKPLVVHQGGTSRKGGDKVASAKRLFHIRQSRTKATRAVEVAPDASSLNSNDIFVLKSPSGNFLWKGRGATAEEMVAAKHVAGMLGGTPTEVAETKEPTSFWEALGGKKSYQTSLVLRDPVLQCPRLFGCSNATGRLIVEEVPGDLDQLDLETDDIMILDTHDQIFIWIGKDANETEKSGCMRIAEDYVNSDPSGRRGTPICIIKHGEEPPSFTGWFMAWDPTLWDKDLLASLQVAH
ncbi:scinderin like a [Dunckerocampus dactyliophorus]|uniref:scinderin like a n=1 Tax=Dunckerocampus dactyliophorus TaxID=161453 RepID=UPI0024063CB5|nr:scinderin like a [Dunckerocampus dactyliophorus]